MKLVKKIALAAALARRDLRGGLGGFGVFLACLALGVAAIAGVQSLSAGFAAGISADAAKLLGGDVEIRQPYVPAEPAQIAFMKKAGDVSGILTMRAMGTAETSAPKPRRTLVSLKAVDNAYPLYGNLIISPDMPLASALAKRNGLFGAVADAETLDRLGLKVGDKLRLANGLFEIRAKLVKEPDRSFGFASLGPRVTISLDSLPQTGLLMPGSLVNYRYRLKLRPPWTPESFADAIKKAYPDAGWRIRDVSRSAPGVSRFIDRLTAILSLVGLAALLLGGLGVSEAVGGHLEAKTTVIATMKCLGASGRLIFTVFLMEVLFLAGLGTVIGLALGALAPYLAAPLVANLMPVRLIPGLYPGPLAISGLFGLLTALLFSLAPLSSARRVTALVLFRGYAAPERARSGALARLAALACAAAMTWLAALAVGDARLALGFAGSVCVAALFFKGVSLGLVRLFKAFPAPKNPITRLTLSSLTRPGNQVSGVIAALGLGLTVLSGMALVDANFRDRMGREIPEMAPAFFFIDIQPHQIEPFRQTLLAIPGVTRLDASPTIRGRFEAVNGQPTAEMTPGQDAAWAARGDRALTYSGPLPKGSDITEGAWWPQDYAGPPQVSVDAEIAKGFGIHVGDELTFNVLGREIKAKVANLRNIDWLTLGMNYVFTLSPGALDGLPLTWIAALYDNEPPADIERGPNKVVFDAVTSKFPNISVISVGEALAEVEAIADKIAMAVSAAAAVTLLAGILVLGQTMRAALRRKTYETVIFKVCGAERRDILSLLLMENALLGAIAGIVALGLGAAMSAFFVSQYMRFPWKFFPTPAIATIAGAAAVTIGLGLIGVYRLLGKKAWPYLRNE